MSAQSTNAPAEFDRSAGVKWAGKLRPGGLSPLAWIAGISLVVAVLGSIPLFLNMEEYRTVATWLVGISGVILVVCGLVAWLLPPELWKLCFSSKGRRQLRDARRLIHRYPRKASVLFQALPDDQGQMFRPGLRRLYVDDDCLIAMFILPKNRKALNPAYREALLRDGPTLLGIHNLEYVAVLPGRFSTRLLIQVVPADESTGVRNVDRSDW